MSGVLRRGSLNFDCTGGSSRGSLDSNLYGGYRETKPVPGTPEISVIAMDFRRHSDDLKKVGLVAGAAPTPSTVKDLSQDVDSDVLSNFLGHYRKWSFMWTFLLCLFQIPTTFHLFMFVFQVSFSLWIGKYLHTWLRRTFKSKFCTVLCCVVFCELKQIEGNLAMQQL